MGGPFFQKNLWLKSLLMVSTLAGRMHSRIREFVCIDVFKDLLTLQQLLIDADLGGHVGYTTTTTATTPVFVDFF